MNDQPLISVVLATYNGSKFLINQLESIYQQTYTNIEVIVCDDKSTDLTQNILATYEKTHSLRYYINETRIGVVGNFAKAISYAQGNYIALSDQDDVWLPNKLKVSFQKIKELEQRFSNKIPLLVYTDLQVVDDNLNCISPSYWKYRKLDQSKLQLNKILVENFMTGCTALMNKATVELALPIPKEALMHDVWFLLVAFSFGQTSYLNEQTVLYRQHSNNVIGSSGKSNFQKLSSAIYKIKNSKFGLLNEEISQAKAFYYLYSSQLQKNDDHKRLLDSFISLKDKNYFVRRFYLIKQSFYGNTFGRFLNVFLRA